MRRTVGICSLLMGAAMLAIALLPSTSLAGGDIGDISDDPNLLYSLNVLFDWTHHPGASKAEICSVYASNAQTLAEANKRQACGFSGSNGSLNWGNNGSQNLPDPLGIRPPDPDPYTINYNYCMNNLSDYDAMLGPQSMEFAISNCSACINDQELLIKFIKLAAKWDCFSASYPDPWGGLDTVTGKILNDPHYGVMSESPSALQQCIKSWDASGSDLGQAKYTFEINTLWCVSEKYTPLQAHFSNSKNEKATPWLGTALDPQSESAPPSPRGRQDQPCGDGRNPCYSLWPRAAIALAQSNIKLRQSILWRFRRLRLAVEPTVTQIALTTPSPEIEKTDRATGAKLKKVNRRDIKPSVATRTIPSAGLLATTPGLSPQGPKTDSGGPPRITGPCTTPGCGSPLSSTSSGRIVGPGLLEGDTGFATQGPAGAGTASTGRAATSPAPSRIPGQGP